MMVSEGVRLPLMPLNCAGQTFPAPNIMAKQKTNEQMLRALLADLHPIEAALLRERIVHIVEETAKAAQESPESFGWFVSPSAYLHLNAKVQKHMGFSGL